MADRSARPAADRQAGPVADALLYKNAGYR